MHTNTFLNTFSSYCYSTTIVTIYGMVFHSNTKMIDRLDHYHRNTILIIRYLYLKYSHIPNSVFLLSEIGFRFEYIVSVITPERYSNPRWADIREKSYDRHYTF